MRRLPSGLATVILGALGAPLAAQEAPGALAPATPVLAPAALPASLAPWGQPLPGRAGGDPAPAPAEAAGLDPDTPCPDCWPPERFWRGAWQLMVVQAIPWSVNRLLRDAEWAHIGPESWFRNFENAWKWDNNAFLNNQISHPYHGNLYFNTGRSNGFSFWESMLWAFGGSLMWEEMFEVWAPAPNDLLNTSLGGITIGESLWRLSSLTLDNTSRGTERVVREAGATLINPVRGFNRLIDGRMNDVDMNPPEWRPAKWRWSLDGGYRWTSASQNDGPTNSTEQWILQAELDFGDSVEDLNQSPFSFMEFFVGLGEKVGKARTVQDVNIRGSLAGRTLKRTDNVHHRLGAYMTYDYFAEPQFEYGAQGFQGGLVSRFGDRQGVRLHTELLALFQPVAALQSDYFLSEEGRDYDYGLGIGTRALARATQEGLGFAEAKVTWIWTPILSGFNGNHFQTSGSIEAKVYPIGGLVGLGGSFTLYHRTSDYDAFPDVSTDATQARLFANFSAPRWTR